MKSEDDKVLDYLKGYVSEHKQQLIDSVLDKRTRHVTVLLEDIYQPQNASAVIRTADCFGLQDVHILEKKHKFKINPRVVHGSSKWVDVHRYDTCANSHQVCLDRLKNEGYKLLATVPDPNAQSIHDISIDEKFALVFGTEMTGITDEMREEVDGFVTIPMYGFTESFNISVSVALALNTVVEKLFSSNVDWKLNEEEKSVLRLQWYRKIVNRSDLLEKQFLKSL
ncbi:TrmH family RNA methyltransferase [Fulvivirga sp. RKSG066]|uniref:TrmH family RNA methyltransferase n=1 Tax=Fulvivirga aurantia TaxID=2529383 RepID=UPI0012BB8F83|nr:RNA methyltransferase [Fulvivirga aurantia]MTI22718.1 TrmH family RNA methyltransferase [Fulvivirga aurantia]